LVIFTLRKLTCNPACCRQAAKKITLEFIKEILPILFLLVLLGSGVGAALVASYLYRKYKHDYLQSYFYYLVLLLIYGIYGLLGNVVSQKILESIETPPELATTIGHFIPFLGVPFLITSLYMLIKLSREIVNTRVNKKFTIGYFIFFIFFFLAYGFVILKLPDVDSIQYEIITKYITFSFAAIQLIVLTIALSWIFSKRRKIKDKRFRNTIRIFSMILGCSILINSISLAASVFSPILYYVYLLIYFIHGLPAILYLAYYFPKYSKPVSEGQVDMGLINFYNKHEITRRESEIVDLICDGKTNKEIANTLFISLQTVKDHTHHIYIKTGARNRIELANMIRDI